MNALSATQSLMLLGLIIAFGGYFSLIWHKHQKGKAMIVAKDARLYPANYHELQKSDRKRLYRIHTWREAWDPAGKILAGISIFGMGIFLIAVVIPLM